jgi:thioredoxin
MKYKLILPALLLSAGLAFSSCGGSHKTDENNATQSTETQQPAATSTAPATAENSADLINTSETPVLVDFYADWCGPCKLMSPVVEELAGKYGAKVKLVKINVDNNHELAQKYQVESIPRFILFKKGAILWQTVGAMPASQFEAGIKPYLQ